MIFGTPFGSAPFGSTGTNTYTTDLSDGATAADALTSVKTFMIAMEETGELTGAVIGVYIPHAVEHIGVGAELDVSVLMLQGVSETATVDEAIVIAWKVFVEDAAIGTALPTSFLTKLEAIEDAVVALGLAASRQDARVDIMEAATVEALARAGWAVEALDALETSDTIVTQLRAMVALQDAATAIGTAAPLLRLTTFVADATEAAAVPSVRATMGVALADGADVFASLRIGSEEFSGWVINTETRATSEYTNFPFNSFAQFAGKCYGASEDGIYELTGDDDAGTPIDAFIRTGLMDFGSRQLKRMPDVFVGFSSASATPLILKVITTTKDGKVEDWYDIVESPATATREGRFKVGRGLKAVYWQLELHNKGGADFDLDSIEWLPLALTRRI
jgi:hypothetical protein